MLPKTYRLAGYRVPPLVRSGRRISNQFISLIYLPVVNSEQLTRLTIVVPKRLSKKAVYRNRTKRLLREAVQHQLPSIKPGYEVIIMAKKLYTDEKLVDVTPQVIDALEQSLLITSKDK